MKLYSVHTQDRMQRTLRGVRSRMILSALTGLMFSLLLYGMSCGFISRLAAVGLFLVYTSAIFVSTIISFWKSQYYLASIPYRGVRKVIFRLFAWPMLPAVAVSYSRMKRGIKQHQLRDEEFQQHLKKHLTLRAKMERMEKFSAEARQALYEYCRNEALATGMPAAMFTQEKFQSEYSSIVATPEILGLVINSLGDLEFTVQAYYTRAEEKYDLGQYNLVLKKDNTFELHLRRTGKLSNERPLPDTIEQELIEHVDEARNELLRWLYAGSIERLVKGVVRLLNDGVVIDQQVHYDVAQHYHKVPEI